MNKTDHNGVEIKPGHKGVDAGPFGDYVWLLRRHDDKLFGWWESRHDAIGAKVKLKAGKREWYEPIRVKTGTVRIADLVIVDGEKV